MNVDAIESLVLLADKQQNGEIAKDTLEKFIKKNPNAVKTVLEVGNLIKNKNDLKLSDLQKEFSIGFAKAARIADIFESAEIVKYSYDSDFCKRTINHEKLGNLQKLLS